EQPNQLAHVVGMQTILRHRPAQPALILAGPVGNAALEVAHQLFRQRRAFRFVFHDAVNDTIGTLYGYRTHLLRLEDPQATSFDHRRSGHTDTGILGGDHDVTGPRHH